MNDAMIEEPSSGCSSFCGDMVKAFDEKQGRPVSAFLACAGCTNIPTNLQNGGGILQNLWHEQLRLLTQSFYSRPGILWANWCWNLSMHSHWSPTSVFFALWQVQHSGAAQADQADLRRRSL